MPTRAALHDATCMHSMAWQLQRYRYSGNERDTHCLLRTLLMCQYTTYGTPFHRCLSQPSDAAVVIAEIMNETISMLLTGVFHEGEQPKQGLQGML